MERDWKYKSSCRPELFCKKVVLRNLTKFTGKHLCQGLFFNKVAGLQLWHRFSLRIFWNLLKHLFTQSTWWLLLSVRALDPHRIILPNCLLVSGALLSDWRSTLLFRSFTKANFELLNKNLHDLRWLNWLACNNSAKLPPLHRPWKSTSIGGTFSSQSIRCATSAYTVLIWSCLVF